MEEGGEGGVEGGEGGDQGGESEAGGELVSHHLGVTVRISWSLILRAHTGHEGTAKGRKCPSRDFGCLELCLYGIKELA